MTKDRLTSPLPTNEGQSDPLISPQEKWNVNFDRQNNGVHMSVEREEVLSLEENQGSSRKMGARKGGKSTKMSCFNPKESKDGVKSEYQAASFREMMRYAEPRDWWMLSGALTGSILTGLTYSLHCYTERKYHKRLKNSYYLIRCKHDRRQSTSPYNDGI